MAKKVGKGLFISELILKTFVYILLFLGSLFGVGYCLSLFKENLISTIIGTLIFVSILVMSIYLILSLVKDFKGFSGNKKKFKTELYDSDYSNKGVTA